MEDKLPNKARAAQEAPLFFLENICADKYCLKRRRRSRDEYISRCATQDEHVDLPVDGIRNLTRPPQISLDPLIRQNTSHPAVKPAPQMIVSFKVGQNEKIPERILKIPINKQSPRGRD